MLVAVLLASVVFFCAVLIAMALMLRGQWDKMGSAETAKRSDPPRR
jgi:hypothetical protein